VHIRLIGQKLRQSILELVAKKRTQEVFFVGCYIDTIGGRTRIM